MKARHCIPPPMEHSRGWLTGVVVDQPQQAEFGQEKLLAMAVVPAGASSFLAVQMR